MFLSFDGAKLRLYFWVAMGCFRVVPNPVPQSDVFPKSRLTVLFYAC